MPEPRLIRASGERFDDYLAMVERTLALGEDGDGFSLIDPVPARRNPQALLQVFDDWHVARNLPKGFVPQTVYWLLDGDGTLCGETRVRHRLSPQLRIEGGHIGYFVHPDHRGRGLGHAILRLALAEVAKHGVDPALVTCNGDNVPSRRVIEGAGGNLKGKGISPKTGATVLAFEVPAAPAR